MIIKKLFTFFRYLRWQLKKTKFFFIPKVKCVYYNENIINDLRNYGISVYKNSTLSNECKTLLNYCEKNITEKNLFEYIRLKNLSNCLKEHYKIKVTDLFKTQDLLKFATQELILNNVTKYFGRKPYLREVNVQIDFSSNESTDIGITQKFHRDWDDVSLIKVFFYLNDVNEHNGPFEFIMQSQKKPWIIFNQDEILSNKNKLKKKSVTGESGTLILADTNGYHRGLKLKKGYRLMAYAMYTSYYPFTGKLESVITR